ncbi:MAG: type IV secretion system protein [Pseudomonadota bacterium]
MLKRTPRTDSAQKSPADAYFEDAATWDLDVYRRLKASRNRAWLLSFIFLGIAALSLVCLALLLPLKQFEPYVITVDKSTGYVEATRGLRPGPLTQDEAITQANLVRYVILRETYDPPDIEENYNRVLLMSEEEALAEYQQLWASSNPDNPARTFGFDVEVDIQIKSINFLNDRTASIRFLRNQAERGVTRTSHWVAIIAFRYVERPERLLERFENPLGFQVTSYRVDQEVLGEPTQ